MNIYVSNLDSRTNNRELRALFEVFGRVESAHAVLDPSTGRCKGYGFIKMYSEHEGTLAINRLDGRDVNGKRIAVSVAGIKPTFDSLRRR